MSVRELKTFEWTCDAPGCKKRVIVQSMWSERPDGWGIVHVPNCGSTNYTRDDVYCAGCYAKEQKKSSAKSCG